MSLRTLLIIIGVAIVALVYAATAYKRRRDARRNFERRFPRMDIPDAMLRHDDYEDDGEGAADEAAGHLPRFGSAASDNELVDVEIVRLPSRGTAPEPAVAGVVAASTSMANARATSAVGAGAAVAGVPPPVAPRIPDSLRIPESLRVQADSRELDELPAIRNEEAVVPPAPPPAPPPGAASAASPAEPSNARKRLDQLDLFGNDQDLVVPEPPPRKRASRQAAEEPGADLVSLFVRARNGQQFTGAQLVRALNAVGMQFGEMDIFHHFGAGELKCDRAVFSAANMYEPGTFNLNKIEAFRTAGVALILQLPGPLDGPVAFELLLNTAQRLTELTGGELYADPTTVLDAPAIAGMRKRVARFAHARA